MHIPVRTVLSVFISALLSGGLANAQDKQEDVKPGLYTTVDEHEIYIIKGDRQVDVKSGESVYVGDEELEFIPREPDFLNWPCGTTYAGGRGSLPGFELESLPPGDRVAEIVRRWFEETRLLQPVARWDNGEFNGLFSPQEIDPYVSAARWYQSGPQNAKLALQRPDTLIIGLFRGTGQVIVDTNHLEELKARHGERIPTVFEYQEENVVPVSYFGDNPSIQDFIDAWSQRGIRLAEVPMWYGGDHHVSVPAAELARLVKAPALQEISPERRAALEKDLRANGFTAKPVNLTLAAGTTGVVADEAERVRVAQSLDIGPVPVQFTYFNDLSAADHCGLPPPTAEVGALGESNGEQPKGPQGPEKPPEIVLPNPPQPEQPVSGN